MKRPVQILAENIVPYALVVGKGAAAGYLARVLQEKGCQTLLLETIPNEEKSTLFSKKFQYIFQFEDAKQAEKLIEKCLTPEGKYLFVETNESKVKLEARQGLKIVKAGSLSSWDLSLLSEKILKAIFSRDETAFVDLRQKNDFIQSAPKENKTILANIKAKEELQNKKDRHSFSCAENKAKTTISSKSIIQPEIKKVYRRKILLLAFLLLFILISTSTLYLYWYLKSVKKIFTNLKTHLASSNIAAVSEDLRQAKEKITAGKAIYDISYKILLPFQQTAFMADIGTVISVSSNLVGTGQELINFLDKFKLNQENNFSNQNKISPADFKDASRKITNLVDALALSKKRMDQTNLPFFPRDAFASFLSASYEKLSSVSELLPIAEKLFVSNQARNYLLLFQNNMELRPTGGFIGSFALATVGSGRLYDFKIFDVYSADGQLKGHVDPPAPIRKYLNQPHWFLRDSNFDPDFAVSSLKADWFLDKEMGKSVDAVIGINLFFIQDLLEAVGSIKLSDFNNEEINSSNFFFKAQFYSQKDFFAGSSQKKDFLSAVSSALQIKFNTDSSLPWLEILFRVKKSLDEKNLIIFVKDENLQKTIEEKGWAGRFTKISCLSQTDLAQEVKEKELENCFPDYLAINEANLGVNKANYFISKSVAIEKRIESETKIITSITLSYENKSIPEVFQGGTYANYLRFFIPKNSNLITASLNGIKIQEDQIDQEQYSEDKKAIGFLVKIAPQNKGVVKITYETLKSSISKLMSYQFLFQKQSGDKVSPLVLSFITPASIKLTPINFKSISEKKQEVYYSTDTSVDRIFAFETLN